MAPSRSVSWTRERIDALATPEVRQLRVNAERLNDPEIMERCDAVLVERRKRGPAKTGVAKTGVAKPGAAAPRAKAKKPQPSEAA
jgi:hypothetical protein